jgi:hypothetical protein
MWPRFIETAVGLWLMFAPWVLGFGNPAAGSDRTVGPLVITFSVMAMWEVLRPVRWVNLAFAAWLIAVPWFWSFPFEALASDLASGAVLGAMALLGGRTSQEFGGGWRFLSKRRPR